ncbi:hypothetical protein J45TS6_20060 [Paenibacillus sp. J45TS6]|uniref:hypothetical protein n=1 Tax=Paenibacillus sp. J45TS6 TaxID=2807196 RepID=UPI001B1473E0|nr:hypothetical protein [Paenibacillus sp. J45TS6]GIP43547.1 hypothetical protein J45TS6_20060 [Paenibacillus sp. J45TS6]
MRKKKTWIILLACLVVLFFGGKWAYNTVIHTAANQISAELAKPEVEQAINQLKEQYLTGDSKNITNDLKDIANEAKDINKDDIKDITNNTNNDTTKNSTKENTVESSPKKDKEDKEDTVFKNQDEALKFVVSRVSVSDIKHVKEIATEGLTEENKQKLQKMALENFTVEEIEAVLEALQ